MENSKCVDVEAAVIVEGDDVVSLQDEDSNVVFMIPKPRLCYIDDAKSGRVFNEM
jgi:hypothetical protein